MAPSKTTTSSKHVSSKAITSRKVAPNPITSRKVTAKKPEKQLKAIFKGLTFSFAGAFPSVSGGFLSHEQMGKWVILHGGTYEREVTSETTHLICTIEEYKKKGPQVLKAWQHSSRTNQCYILVFEWLEDSLTGKFKRKRAERGYTLDRTLARIKKGKMDHVAFRNRFEEGVRASKELCDGKLHKVYFDLDGFEYKIMLTHLDLSYNGKAKIEKYTLYLFESIAAPHTYMCGAKLSRTHRPISYYREVCFPKPYKEAIHDFKLFFKDKTKITWDDRLEGIRIGDPKAFVYTPPAVGRPVGILPFGYIRPEERPVVMTESETSDESGSGSGSSGSGSGSGSSGSGTDTTSATATSESVEYDTDSDVDSDDDDDEPQSLSTSNIARVQQSPTIYIPEDIALSSFENTSQSQNTPSSSTLSFVTGFSSMTQSYQSNSSNEVIPIMTPNGSFPSEENDYQRNSQEDGQMLYGLGIYKDTPNASFENSQAPTVSTSFGAQVDFQLPLVSSTFGTQSSGDQDISQREYIVIDSD